MPVSISYTSTIVSEVDDMKEQNKDLKDRTDMFEEHVHQELALLRGDLQDLRADFRRELQDLRIIMRSSDQKLEAVRADVAQFVANIHGL